jgi:DNA-binding FadR family transcriptional regulator
MTEASVPPHLEDDELIARRATLFDAIAHGDEEHRTWLKAAIDAHFAGQPVPPCAGKGRKEAEIAALREEIERKDEALRPFAEAADIKLCGEWEDNEHFGQTDVGFHLTFGDLRQARAALNKDTPHG